MEWQLHLTCCYIILFDDHFNVYCACKSKTKPKMFVRKLNNCSKKMEKPKNKILNCIHCQSIWRLRFSQCWVLSAEHHLQYPYNTVNVNGCTNGIKPLSTATALIIHIHKSKKQKSTANSSTPSQHRLLPSSICIMFSTQMPSFRRSQFPKLIFVELSK